MLLTDALDRAPLEMSTANPSPVDDAAYGWVPRYPPTDLMREPPAFRTRTSTETAAASSLARRRTPKRSSSALVNASRRSRHGGWRLALDGKRRYLP